MALLFTSGMILHSAERVSNNERAEPLLLKPTFIDLMQSLRLLIGAEGLPLYVFVRYVASDKYEDIFGR